MMKGKMFKRLGATTLVLTLISMSLMGGTLAKYTTTVSGEANATVAKFVFDLNGAKQSTSTSTIAINDLFKNSYNDGQVNATDKKVVAPGTSGKQEFKLVNNGEVTIKANNLTITENNTNSIPLQYAITDGATAPTDAGDWKNKDELVLPTFNDLVNNASQTFYLHWRWNPNSDNASDTKLGTEATANVSINVSCTVEQVVPTT